MSDGLEVTSCVEALAVPVLVLYSVSAVLGQLSVEAVDAICCLRLRCESKRFLRTGY